VGACNVHPRAHPWPFDISPPPSQSRGKFPFSAESWYARWCSLPHDWWLYVLDVRGFRDEDAPSGDGVRMDLSSVRRVSVPVEGWECLPGSAVCPWAPLLYLVVLPFPADLPTPENLILKSGKRRLRGLSFEIVFRIVPITSNRGRFSWSNWFPGHQYVFGVLPCLQIRPLFSNRYAMWFDRRCRPKLANFRRNVKPTSVGLRFLPPLTTILIQPALSWGR